MSSIPFSTGVPMGTILPFFLNANNIPKGWLLCDGSKIPSQYTKLISALGGLQNTPNLSGRTLIGTGTPSSSPQSDGRIPNSFPPSTPALQNNYLTIGYTGGEYVHVLSEVEMPSHSHTINSGQFGVLGIGLDTENGGYTPFCSGTNPGTVFGPNGTDSSGSNYAHNNMQPYMAVNYIIYTGQNN